MLEGEKPLRGWKAIARYLRSGILTAQRLKGKGLPIHRTAALGVHAYPSELNAWVKVFDQAKPALLDPKRTEPPQEEEAAQLGPAAAPPASDGRLTLA